MEFQLIFQLVFVTLMFLLFAFIFRQVFLLLIGPILFLVGLIIFLSSGGISLIVNLLSGNFQFGWNKGIIFSLYFLIIGTAMFISGIIVARAYNRKMKTLAEKRLPLVLKILTADSLIEGTLKDDPPLYAFARDPIQIPLTSVRIQPTGAEDIPVQTYSQYVVSSYDVLALIFPEDIFQIYAGYPGTELIVKRYKMCKHALQGVFYCGNYAMEGKRMSLSGIPEHPMILTDVHIQSRNPKSYWDGLKASLVLVNTRWLEGHEPR